MDKRFLEDGLGLREVAELEVRGGVFGDLFPEAGLELQEVVVDSGSYDCEGVVEVGECEEGFALYVRDCYVDRIECRSVVVEYPKEVVVVVQQVLIFLTQWRRCRSCV